jgi:hypothetical protein
MGRRLKRLWGVVVCLLAVACAPSQASIETAIAQTQAAAPTNTVAPTVTIQPTATVAPTATPEPFDVTTLEIDPAIIDVEGLGLRAGVPTNEKPVQFYTQSVRPGEYHLSRQLLDQSGKFAGWVSFFVFEDVFRADSAYLTVVANMAQASLSDPTDVGEKAIYFEDGERSGIAVLRCHALMTVMIGERLGQSILRSFAEQLLTKLEPYVCDPT